MTSKFHAKLLIMGMLMGELIGDMTRGAKRNYVRQSHKRKRSALKPVKGMPAYGQVVLAETKYGRVDVKCTYTHKRFWPHGQPYSFSWHEIVGWR